MPEGRLPLLALLLLRLGVCEAFNLATEYVEVLADPVWNGPGNSNGFGYTVDLLDDARPNTYRILVGAPKSMSSAQPHISLRNPGVTHTCTYREGQPISCAQMVLERNGWASYSSPEWNYVERKDNAFIGLALATNPQTRQVVVCGPGWKNQYYSEHYLMNGVCYTYPSELNPAAEATKLLPLIQFTKQGFQVPANDSTPTEKSFYYSYGEAGMSVHLCSGSSGEVVIGAPGVFMWSGTIIRLRGPKQEPGRFEDINIPNPYLSQEVPTYSYMGYAVSSGHFTRGPELYYVGSAPRIKNKGSVFIFTFPQKTEHAFDIKMQLSGTQLGEYFGAALCVMDINQDGLDDLLVGAPQHTNKGVGHASGDEGRVYLFMNQDGRLVAAEAAILGTHQMGARFGSAISNIGDLNLDGYPDVAIGAPYEVADTKNAVGTGAVYIYLGQKDGLSTKYSQRITSRSAGYGVRGFGISISRGVDIDNNGYLDLVVGAYESGHIAVFRSHPIIDLTSRLFTQLTSIQLNTTAFNVTACLTYTGDRRTASLDANITVTLDRTQNRVTFKNLKNTLSFVTTVTRDLEKCHTLEVFMKPISDWNDKIKYSSLMVAMRSSMVKRETSGFCKTCPVLDPEADPSTQLKIPVLSKCNKEDVCIPDWHLAAEFPNTKFPFVVGSRDTLDLKIHIINHGDSANLRHLNVQLPANVTLRSIPGICEKAENSTWDCYNGQLVLSNQTKTLDLVLDMRGVSTVSRTSLTFVFTAYSFDGDDKVAVESVDIVRDTRVELVARAVPDIYVRTTEDRPGVMVVHSYYVYSRGQSPVDSLDVTVLIPISLRHQNSHHTLAQVYRPKVSLNLKPVQCISDHEFAQDDTLATNISTNSSEAILRRRRKREVGAQAKKAVHLDCSHRDVTCIAVRCTTGSLFTSAQGLHVDVHMKVHQATLDILLKEAFQVQINTSISVNTVPVISSLHQSVGTRFEGSAIPERETPFFWWYILLGIILAILILGLLIYILFKCKFFERHRVGEEDENNLMLSSEFPNSKNAVPNQQTEGDNLVSTEAQPS